MRISFVFSLSTTRWILRFIGVFGILVLSFPTFCLELLTEPSSQERISAILFSLINTLIMTDWLILRERKEEKKYLEHLITQKGGARDTIFSLIEQQSSLATWTNHPSFQFAKSPEFSAWNISKWCSRSRHLSEEELARFALLPDSKEWELAKTALFLLEVMCDIATDRYITRYDFKRYESCLKAILRAKNFKDLPTATLFPIDS